METCSTKDQPPSTKIRISLSNTLTRHGGDPLSLNQFTVWSELKGRTPFCSLSEAKRVEVLWKNTYNLLHPDSSHLSRISKEEMVDIIKLCDDLVDEGKMYVSLVSLVSHCST